MAVIKYFSMVTMIRDYCHVIVKADIRANTNQAFEPLTKIFLKAIYNFGFKPTSVSVHRNSIVLLKKSRGGVPMFIYSVWL